MTFFSMHEKAAMVDILIDEVGQFVGRIKKVMDVTKTEWWQLSENDIEEISILFVDYSSRNFQMMYEIGIVTEQQMDTLLEFGTWNIILGGWDDPVPWWMCDDPK